MDGLEQINYQRLDYADAQIAIASDTGDSGFLTTLADGDGDTQLAVQIIVALAAGTDGLVLDERERGEPLERLDAGVVEADLAAPVIDCLKDGLAFVLQGGKLRDEPRLDSGCHSVVY